jgi:putative ATP-binding cassette transporter
MAFSHLIGAFSLIVTQFQQISSYAVVLARLGDLGDAVERIEASAGQRIERDESGTEIAFHDLTLRSPRDGGVLVRSLSARVPAGTRVLVTGPEPARVALFRATAGLWDAGEGRIVLPPPGEVLFVTERPYLPPGTLREVLVAGGQQPPADDAAILEALREFGVEAVVQRAGGLDAERDWDELLSLGEQQALALARILLIAPRFACLDRPGTVLGARARLFALDVLTKRSIALLTFADDDAELAARHDARLELAVEGSWRWQERASA